VTLSTVHAAKGTEHDHVLLIGRWPLKGDRSKQEEERRAFYVGMTRARQSLTVFAQADAAPSLPASLTGPFVQNHERSGAPRLTVADFQRYEVLALDEINLGYAGYFSAAEPIHQALRSLQPRDLLRLQSADANGLALHHSDGTCVARLSRKGNARWADHVRAVREVRVVAMLHRTAVQDADSERSDRCRVAEWEVPIVELVYDGRTTNRAGR
jgi:ATP-dependent DNA helicase RecQ